MTTDPLEFLRICESRYGTAIHDYRCRFIKQERIGETLKPEQHIDVRFRETPFSVDMCWIKNPGRAKRVTYVAGRRVENGQPMACIIPDGVVGLLTRDGVWRPIHAPPMTTESRRPIDQFGFQNILRKVITVCEAAQGHPGYQLTFRGEADVHGRRCYVLHRRLPDQTTPGEFPDRIMLLHIDREWLVPLSYTSFADENTTELSAKYVFTNVELNIGLTDADFE